MRGVAIRAFCRAPAGRKGICRTCPVLWGISTEESNSLPYAQRPRLPLELPAGWHSESLLTASGGAYPCNALSASISTATNCRTSRNRAANAPCFEARSVCFNLYCYQLPYAPTKQRHGQTARRTRAKKGGKCRWPFYYQKIKMKNVAACVDDKYTGKEAQTQLSSACQ